MSSEEERHWRNATIIMLLVSLLFLAIQAFYGFFLVWYFQLFTIYIPTAISVIVYLWVRIKSRRRRVEGLTDY
ncbi:MAG: hypothetical protein NXY59_04085 [Aigarchaeota archaeon]|nr:hypothetical protein [Candidatus Pelearchaeum maunauluense]